MTQKAIGPSFVAELVAAGLSGVPISWCADGTITYDVAITDEQRAGVEAVYAAHDALVGERVTVCASIDAAAEACRLWWITPGAGQALVYARKRDQAVAWLAWAAGGSPNPDDFPLLAAEIGITADPETGEPATDCAGVARAIMAVAAAWDSAAAVVERLRLTGKRDVNALDDPAAMRAVAAAIEWPAP